MQSQQRDRRKRKQNHRSGGPNNRINEPEEMLLVSRIDDSPRPYERHDNRGTGGSHYRGSSPHNKGEHSNREGFRENRDQREDRRWVMNSSVRDRHEGNSFGRMRSFNHEPVNNWSTRPVTHEPRFTEPASPNFRPEQRFSDAPPRYPENESWDPPYHNGNTSYDQWQPRAREDRRDQYDERDHRGRSDWTRDSWHQNNTHEGWSNSRDEDSAEGWMPRKDLGRNVTESRSWEPASSWQSSQGRNNQGKKNKQKNNQNRRNWQNNRPQNQDKNNRHVTTI
ncbi:hypothetical protein SISNIDRAFT_193451 [Sistotremastrum niveocremeum HHB9708]|uniref:Uncharacterized protein n=1 Tax=Sistotremastrum niveocremeum HHB9708 TaxID=1314777 RepID=A0A164ZG06_9AGAM|nr:hypothetical protein SISNIDRAFT_193451 [Sistotremastrum niveocremeum HHB9708]